MLKLKCVGEIFSKCSGTMYCRYILLIVIIFGSHLMILFPFSYYLSDALDLKNKTYTRTVD